MKRLPAVLLLTLIAATAQADARFGVPAPGDGDRTVYASANTAGPAQYDTDGTAGSALNICVPFGETIQLKAKDAEWLGTLTMDPSVSMPLAVDATGGCYVTDPDVAAASGRGSCISVTDGERLYVEVQFTAVYSRPGARTTVCSSAVRALNDRWVRPPCSADGDCTAAGAGTCVTGTQLTVAQLEQVSCAYVVGQVDTVSGSITVAGAKRP